MLFPIPDVFEELPEHLRPAKAVREPEPESPLREVLAVLTHEEGLHVDAIAARLGQTSATVAESLLQLELEGWIRALPGARYVRAK